MLKPLRDKRYLAHRIAYIAYARAKAALAEKGVPVHALDIAVRLDTTARVWVEIVWLSEGGDDLPLLEAAKELFPLPLACKLTGVVVPAERVQREGVLVGINTAEPSGEVYYYRECFFKLLMSFAYKIRICDLAK